MQKAEMSKSFESQSSNLPLGSDPILLARIHTKRNGDDRTVLCMHPGKGNGIELALNNDLLHAIVNLITKAVTQANWDLALAAKDAYRPVEPDTQITIN